MRIPIFGAGIASKSKYVTAKKLTNIYCEQRPQGEKSSIVGFQVPGKTLFVDFGSTAPRGGLEFEANSVAYVVHRNILWEVNNAAIKVNRGTLLTTTGRVSIAHNGTQVIIVDGTFGYLYSTVPITGTPQTISSITRSGTVGTLTTAAPHGLVTGNLVTLAGVTPVGFNGDYTVTVTGLTTFTFNMLADPGGNASVVGTYTISSFLTITQIPTQPSTITFLSGRFIATFENSGRYYTSAVYDGLFWDPLAFANAEASPDPLVAVWANNGQLSLFGSLTTEFAGNSGTLDFAFTSIQGASNEWGLAARWSVAKYDNSVACLIKNRMGQVMVAQMSGYLPKKISTPDIDSIINGYAAYSDATAYSYMLGGHPMYVLSFPSAGATWLYDGSTSMWTELKSYNDTRDISEFSFTLLGNTIVADYSTGKIYKLTATALTENGNPIVRELVSENIADPDLDRISIDKVRLDMEVGDGLANDQGSNPQIALSISRDNGNTYDAETWKASGNAGEYKRRVEWRRCGTAREFTLKFRMTDPVPLVIVDASVNPKD